jgi:hypothetical protein
MSEVREPLEEDSGEAKDVGPTEPEERRRSWREHRRERRRPPSVFWPIVLIGAGVVLLLANLGYLRWESWNVLWRLWPLLLVALGIDIFIGRRSTGGAILSAFLILLLLGAVIAVALFAQNIPAIADWAKPVELQSQHVEYPIAGVETASVNIDWTSQPGYLSALGDSANLIEGDISYYGDLTFDVKVHGKQADVVLDSHVSAWPFWSWSDEPEKRWDVKLNTEVPLDLNLDTGSGHCDFDLSRLKIDSLTLNSGSGSIVLALPSDSDFDFQLDSGSGSIAITLPQGVGARVTLDSGSGSFNPDQRFTLVEGERGEDGIWETDNYRTAEHTVQFTIDQGSGSISID